MAANITVNSGMLEFRTDAVPLSICSSAQAMRMNGITMPTNAQTATLNQRAGGRRTGVFRITITTPTARAPKNKRPSVTSRGDVSSTITLMNRNEAPQMAPSASRASSALGVTSDRVRGLQDAAGENRSVYVYGI